MKILIRSTLLIIMTLSTLVLVACGAGSQQTTELKSSKEENGSGEKDKLKIALPSTMFLNLPDYIAQEKGFFEEENLEVEFLNIADSSVPVKTLIAGEVDLAYTGTSETLAAASKGAKLKVLGGINLGLHYGFYVGSKTNIEKVEDIIGKNVAVSSPGSLPHVAILSMLNKAGVNQKEIDKIKWVPISGSGARIQGVIAGKVDATVSSYKPEVMDDPNIKMLSVVSEELPDFLMTSWDTSDKVIEEKRDALKRFMKAELKAVRFILNNKEEALAIAKELELAQDDKTLQAYYDFYTTKNIWRVNGETTGEAVQYMQKLNKETGIQDKVLPSEQVFDGSLLQEVLDEIGRE